MAGYGYNNTTDPKKVSGNQRALITQTGDQLRQKYSDQYAEQQGGAPVNTTAGTANYLNTIEDPLAQGKGGYNANETSQIELSPEDKQNIISGAGISAGAQNASAVGSADRAAAGAGGSPSAQAAYRARAADAGGSQAGDAMTQARVGTKALESQAGQAVGNARLAQQNQGLNYYSNQNTQANQNSQQDNQLESSAYGTEAGAGNAATSNAITASQTPTTTDKVVGGIGGFLGALDEGSMPSGRSAIAGENGPEWVGKPQNYLDMMASPEGSEPDAGSVNGPMQNPGSVQKGDDKAGIPFWQRIQQQQQSQQQPPVKGTGYSEVDTYTNLGKGAGKAAKSAAEMLMAADGTTPSSVSVWSNLGKGIGDGIGPGSAFDEIGKITGGMGGMGGGGGGAGADAGEAADTGEMSGFMMADGGFGVPANRPLYSSGVSSVPPQSMLAGGTIVTKPTDITLEKGEAVVPLGYRATAKVRPSMAMKKPGRQMYGQAA